MLTRHHQSGLSLVELMVAMAISLLVIAGAVAVFTNGLGSNRDMVANSRLTQEMRAIMSVVTRDLRRARYWGNAGTTVLASVNTGAAATPANPFNAITVGSGNTCILYSYDRNQNGTLDTAASSDERYGFALENGRVVMRPQGTTDFTCPPTINTWTEISDPRVVTITGLQFTLTQTSVPVPNSSNVMKIDSIQVTLAARLTGNASSIPPQTLSETVKVRNNRFN